LKQEDIYGEPKMCLIFKNIT